MKSVPDLISYLHEFSQICSHLVSIFLARKTDFRGFQKLENHCRRVPPVVLCFPRRGPPIVASTPPGATLRAVLCWPRQHSPRMCRALKSSPTAPAIRRRPFASRARPDSLGPKPPPCLCSNRAGPKPPLASTVRTPPLPLPLPG
jgi:hypothetical protein